MPFSPLLMRLINSLQCQPGVGRRGAQRIALHLLQHDVQGAAELANSLSTAIDEIGKCSLCNNLSEYKICSLCADSRRAQTQLCVVETPADAAAVESSGEFRGLYFVLGGRLSPIDGIGPEDINLDALRARVASPDPACISEVVLATNSTLEGQVTADYICAQLKDLDVVVSRIAHGVPIGGELEYIDGSTLALAFSQRAVIGKTPPSS